MHEFKISQILEKGLSFFARKYFAAEFETQIFFLSLVFYLTASDNLASHANGILFLPEIDTFVMREKEKKEKFSGKNPIFVLELERFLELFSFLFLARSWQVCY